MNVYLEISIAIQKSFGRLEKTFMDKYIAGSSNGGDIKIRLLGWNFTTTQPTIVLCQARQSDNADRDYQDQFAIQVIDTAQDYIRVRIRRLDDGTGASGWGQNLRIDVLAIE